MNHKAKIVNRLDDLRLPTKIKGNDRYNKGVEDSQYTILEYMKQQEDMFWELTHLQEFWEKKSPEYIRDLQDKFDAFKNSFVNLVDLNSFPQEDVENKG